MVTRRIFLGGLIGSAIAPSVLRAQQVAEPEFLKTKLADGSLPPMAQRIPVDAHRTLRARASSAAAAAWRMSDSLPDR